MTQSTRHAKPPDTHTKVRTSVSLPQDVHAEPKRLARIKQVSLAWVIRDTAEKYIADQKQGAISKP